jgi:hypothetical protein
MTTSALATLASLAFLLSLSGCVDPVEVHPDAEFPSCAEVGCPDTEPLLCTRDGRCACEMQTCQRPAQGDIHP